jgi:pSer/pThr/pTyr-binding forkhead associated (FHA) protein
MEAALNGPFGRIILEPAIVTIGSAPDNRLVVSNYAVSSHHAEIRPEGRGHSITDLGSAYGTFVNDRRLDWNVPYLLNPGDTILIGDTRCTYELRETSQVEATPGATGVESDTEGIDRRSGEASAEAEATINRALWERQPAHTAYGLDLPEAYRSPVYPAYPLVSYPDRNPAQPSYVPQPWSTTGVPPEDGGDGGAINLAPRKASRRKLWIPLSIVAVVLLAGVLVFFFVIRSTPDKTLDAFCNSMQKGDYKAAYGQFSPTLQKMQSEPQFESENKLTSCMHDSATQSGGTAMANLTTVSSSGKASSGQITLVQDSNSNWKINALPSTPSITLDAFCNAIKTRDYQTVYNQLSSRVRGQNSEPEFANGLAQSGIATCTHGPPIVSNNTATGTMTFFNSTGQRAQYIVTLIKEGNIWKIDDLTSS